MKNIIFTLAITFAFTSNVLAAIDIDSFNAEEQSVFCQGLWKAAKSAATERDKGVSEDEVLGRLEDVFRNNQQLGYKYKHLYRTTVKGAYVNTSQSPSKYAGNVQSSCMQAFN